MPPQASGDMHIIQSTTLLNAPQNESSITLLVRGENEHLTEMIHEMCLRAVRYAVEPLQEPEPSP